MNEHTEPAVEEDDDEATRKVVANRATLRKHGVRGNGRGRTPGQHRATGKPDDQPRTGSEARRRMRQVRRAQ